MTETTTHPGVATGTRIVRAAREPTLSVVVASTRERTRLDRCLGALDAPCRALGAELVVARAADPAELDALRAGYPDMRFVGGPEPVDERALRELGMLSADGDIVVFVDDGRCTVPGVVAAAAWDAGSGDGGRPGGVDWAGYFAGRSAAEGGVGPGGGSSGASPSRAGPGGEAPASGPGPAGA